MKKSYIIAAALLAVVGCSKNQVEAPAELYPEGTPVPVQFSAPTISVVTKAVNPETNLVEGDSAAGLEVGVYGLETQDRNLVWDSADETTYIADLLNRNVTIAEDGSITFENPKCYYPLSSEKTFSFYGYYPYSADAQSGSDACTVSYDLTQGNVDILWAAAYATDLDASAQPVGAKGYNAAYIRRLVNANPDHPYLPSFSFEHKLTALKFVTSPYPGESAAGAEMQVVGFELRNVATQIDLTVASTTTEDCGTVASAGTGDLVATGADGGALAVTPVEEGADIRTFTLLPGESYEAVITISRDGVAQEPQTVTVTNTNGGSFEAGKIYTMNIRIKSPVEVEIFTASVVDWVDGGDINIDL